MTKKELQTAVNLFKKVSNQYGITDKMVRQDGEYIYIDGEIYTEYNCQGYSGYDFKNKVDSELESRGFYLEPHTYSVLSLVKN